MNNNIIYACENHVDEAMDDLINIEETFPIMEECNKGKCKYCNKEAKYLIKLPN
ncbi:hypothetical protein JCM1393_12480 [Clostridium carnis]